MKEALKSLGRSWPLRALKPLALPVLKLINRGVRALASVTHQAQLLLEWGVAPEPEWFDHHIDLMHAWSATRTPLWVERGCFSLLAVRDGSRLLELCCGDGFNAKHFYSIRARRVTALDFDPAAIAHARRVHAVENVDFATHDIRHELPVGPFDNVAWDAAIEHFAPAEIDAILGNIKLRLQAGGVLSGYTLAAGGEKALSHHEHEFASKEELVRVLAPHFRNVRVFETIYPSRHNLYFYASDGPVPFDDAWPLQARHPA